MPEDDLVDRNASQYFSVFNRCNFEQLTFGQLLSFISPDQKILIRNIEKLNKKNVCLKYGVKFCELCIKEGLLPKFTNIYIYIYIFLFLT